MSAPLPGPSESNQEFKRPVSCASRGSQISGALPATTPQNRSAAIPTITTGTPFTTPCFPTAERSPPSASIQYPYRIIAGQGFGPGRSSVDRKDRPAAGETPSTSKQSVDTIGALPPSPEPQLA